MSEMLTAKQMQERLHIDRSTIYRMAEAGRIPAIKVGKQWRFPSDAIDRWVQSQSTAPVIEHETNGRSAPVPVQATEDLDSLLPLECVQLIQDSYADLMGVMLVVTDMQGNPITVASNPCGLFQVVNQTPGAIQKCMQSWQSLALSLEIEPQFTESHLGLLCARGLIRVGSELKGMVVAGCIAPQLWPPQKGQIASIAAEFGLASAEISPHMQDVYHLEEDQRTQVLIHVQRLANIVAHIIDERVNLVDRLSAIASLAKI